MKIKAIIIALATGLVLAGCEPPAPPTNLPTPPPPDVPLGAGAEYGNKGIVIYAGSATVVYQNTHGYEKNQTENIDVIVNFDNKTIRYSGQVAGNSFSIDAEFDDDGVGSGEVFFGNSEFPVEISIGQYEIKGTFGKTGWKQTGGILFLYRSE